MKAIFKNLISALVANRQIKTTEGQAKAIRGLVDRLISQAKEGTLEARRRVGPFLTDKKIVNKLVDEIAPKFKDRQSGFTRIIKIGRRVGDGAMMARIEFVEFSEEPAVPPAKLARKRQTRLAKRKTSHKKKTT